MVKNINYKSKWSNYLEKKRIVHEHYSINYQKHGFAQIQILQIFRWMPGARFTNIDLL